MAKIEGNASYLAGRIQALNDTQAFIIKLIPPDDAANATSPGGAGIESQRKAEDALKHEAQQYQDAEAFGEGYAEEFNKVVDLLRSLS